MDPRIELKNIQDELLGIKTRATNEKRNFTNAEMQTIETKSARATELKTHIARIEKSEKALADLVNFGRDDDGDDLTDSKTSYLALTGARGAKAARKFATALAEAGGTKALPGSTVATQVIFEPTPIEPQRIPTSILDLLRVKQRQSPTWKGIRQTGFTNNATVVPAGAKKPTSPISIDPTDGFVVVVAHLSEYVDTYLLKDNDTLSSFVERNLFWGLKEALEEEILNGTGVDDTFDGKTRKNIKGILNTTGVRQQTYTGDRLVTLRAASTKLETTGFTTDAYVVNPADWEAIETHRNTSGQFDLGGAVNLAKRRVWDAPVVTSSRLAVGTALALSLDSLNLDTDELGIHTMWYQGDEGFERNQIRARVEGRFGLSVERPEGIVVAELTAE
ncbi:phage major capsid protein [Microbacterium enclense]|uniref:phage major capsid protein n=1 Tax=Microbacterium enclense TaxID=993073 RepID=UPI003D76111B